VSSDEPTAADLAAMRAELRALRERNQELENQRNGSRHQSVGSIARSTTVVVLLVLATLCVTLAPVTVWGRNLVLNTDHYVTTLTPVAANPGVQNLVIRSVDNQVASHIDVKTLVAETLPPKAAILAAPLQSAVASLINSVTTRFVRSPSFQTVWVTVNRTAHTQLVYLLTGRNPAGSAVTLSNNGEVTLQLAPIVEQVKSRLVAAGLTVAKNIPAVGATIVIAHAKGLAQARRAVRDLDTIADVLPWVGLVLFAAAIAAARRRRRALTISAFCTAGGMVFLGLALLVVRRLYVDRIDPTKVPHDTAAFLFNTLVRFLRDGIRIVLAVAVVVVVLAWVTGPSPRAVWLRHGVASAPRAAAVAASHGPLAQLAREHTRGCRIGIIATALFVLVLFTGISLVSVIVLAVIAVLLLLAVEWLRASAAAPPRAPA
jgi:hypothetical protein